ncbi:MULTISPECIES: gamma carbonic anhydrase family protein [Magnetospirillum]|uniref:Gamma carbonic anhydrase family protein n=1 Tax=Magnetospirillum moscoviense TaxID=1437059 RepID=A0A178MJS8_9PROT|nr:MULTISPECIES: gamma carbonic anhydrase family protein [Magnetospirillum]MBF0325617.1 gamma carbonic anhydrase family protein [Alphaproteobacteria bacterium]OAN48991.1 gamma carbonic anhydrase family protein [Magnetospirillum moscoviense]CAA7623816.1 Protein YrdA [Magnetospirillum sp. LM-5]
MSGLILPHKGITPTIDASCFIAPNATVIGDVVIGEGTSVWFGCVIRGDVHEIRIGARTNIQDGTIVHVTGGKLGTYIGSDITIGHGAILHACRLEDACFIGMGAVLLDGVVVESGAMVAAGAMVPPGKRVKAGELWAGNPAKPMRDLKQEEIDFFPHSAANYVNLAGKYLAEIG